MSNRPPFRARSSSVALQRAIVKEIRAQGINVWDGTNKFPEYPFIKIGEELTSGRTISKDAIGKMHNLTLHIWSDYDSSFEVKSLADFLVDLLINSPLNLEDGFCIGEKSLDHVRYTEAANGTYKNERAYLFLDFEVIDSMIEP